MLRLGFIFLLIVAALGSFFLTLMLLDTHELRDSTVDNRSDADKLAGYKIFDFGDLVEAAVRIGMHRSGDMKGVVDDITRINASEVAMRGWLVDFTGQSRILTIVVFVAGKMSATAQTQVDRPDVVTALKLEPGQNVGFQLTLDCHAGDDLVTVGLGSHKEYFWLSTARCP
jgi:hypothetical protein